MARRVVRTVRERIATKASGGLRTMRETFGVPCHLSSERVVASIPRQLSDHRSSSHLPPKI